MTEPSVTIVEAMQEPALFGGTFGGGAQAFFKILRDWREEGSLAGLDRD